MALLPAAHGHVLEPGRGTLLSGLSGLGMDTLLRATGHPSPAPRSLGVYFNIKKSLWKLVGNRPPGTRPTDIRVKGPRTQALVDGSK